MRVLGFCMLVFSSGFLRLLASKIIKLAMKRLQVKCASLVIFIHCFYNALGLEIALLFPLKDLA